MYETWYVLVHTNKNNRARSSCIRTSTCVSGMFTHTQHSSIDYCCSSPWYHALHTLRTQYLAPRTVTGTHTRLSRRCEQLTAKNGHNRKFFSRSRSPARRAPRHKIAKRGHTSGSQHQKRNGDCRSRSTTRGLFWLCYDVPGY